MARWNILVVEDNPQHRRLLKARLQQAGVDVTTVENAAQFLAVVQQRDFHCIVMDYELPGGCADGLLANAAGSLHDCPVIVVSSYREQEIAVTVLRQGGFDFLTKEAAFSGEELWRRVEVALVNSQRRRLERRSLERRERNLAAMAEIDHLTGLGNRRYFDRCLTDRRWHDNRRKNLSAVLFDIDHFKCVNDTFGHPAGDAALKAVAQRVRQCATKHDVLVRWGGEEVLIVRQSPTPLEAWLWAEGLRRRIEGLDIAVEGQSIKVTISGAVLHCAGAEFDLDRIGTADKALYLAKQQGRNRIYPADMAIWAQELTVAQNQRDLAPMDRWQQLLERLRDHIGPIRCQHIVAHGRRVREVAVHAARNLMLPQPEVERVGISGLIHDIGHGLIPEEIFSKPTVLSMDEYRLIRSHDHYSAWMADGLGFEPAVTQCLLHHHDRFDQNGTPSPADQAVAAPAPIAARLICAADALVAMVTPKSYAPARTLDSAMGEMRKGQGAQFDPDVVRAIGSVQRLDRLLAA